MTVEELEQRRSAALDRYRAYQRRWRSGRSFDCETTIGFAHAYLRREKVIDGALLRGELGSHLQLVRGGAS